MKTSEFNEEPSSLESGFDEHEVKRLINSGKKSEALKCLLSSKPSSSKTEMVLTALNAIRASEIDKAVENLDQDQIDTLMKYLYKGFENPGEGGSTHLLAWHEKAYAVGGAGSIVRVLTDRPRL